MEDKNLIVQLQLENATLKKINIELQGRIMQEEWNKLDQFIKQLTASQAPAQAPVVEEMVI